MIKPASAICKLVNPADVETFIGDRYRRMGMTAPPEGATVGRRVPKAGEALWDRSLRALRPAISDEGFDMPGFVGHYYMWPEEYSLLSKYVDLTQGDYLEIGSMCGIISMSLARKYPKRSFVCVDNFSAGHATIAGNKDAFLQNLKKHDLTNVSLIEGDSLEVVPTLSQNFDLVFIDGNHSYEYVLGDALNSWRFLNAGGFVAFHDYGCVEQTTHAVEDFLLQTGARLVEVASCLAVACKPSKPGTENNDRLSELALNIGELQELQGQVIAMQKKVGTQHRQMGSSWKQEHAVASPAVPTTVEMINTSSPPTTTSRLALIHTQLGFELLADPADYVSKLLIRDEIYESPETDLVTRLVRRGDTCIDAGCQIGFYSCLFAKLVGEKGHVYSFDANPQACFSTKRNLGLNGFSFAEVIHAALADTEGRISFHVSSDDQTGLSSLGPIPTTKEIISVPCLRLESFMKERRIDRIRLLKLDVEGAEEIVLKGLGPILSNHAIDYILIECFDERLKLLGTSTQRIANILESAGYNPWEYGIEAPSGWSRAAEVRSRGDCNYLFVNRSIAENIAPISLAPALHWTQFQRDQVLSTADDLRQSMNKLQGDIDKLQGDIDWLLESIKTHEQESAGLAAAKRHLENVLGQIQSSASWRMLTKWRKLRDRLAPEHSWHRRVYDSILGAFRGNA